MANWYPNRKRLTLSCVRLDADRVALDHRGDRPTAFLLSTDEGYVGGTGETSYSMGGLFLELQVWNRSRRGTVGAWLDDVPANLGGGVRWYWRCPKCDTRRKVLFLAPRSLDFGCRACLGLAYLSDRDQLRLDRGVKKGDKVLGSGGFAATAYVVREEIEEEARWLRHQEHLKYRRKKWRIEPYSRAFSASA